MTTIELYCQTGKHMWSRESQRGKRPLNCPEHSTAVPVVYSLTRTLHCAAGHDYEAPRQRGRAPRYCPEHQQSDVPAEQKAEANREALKATVAHHAERVERAVLVDDQAYAELLRNKGDKAFEGWLRANGVLLNEVLALRNREAML